MFATTAGLVTAIGPRAAAQTATDNPLVDRGHELFETGCASCHGENGTGVITSDGEVRGPPLQQAGEAAAYYQLSTGRMPLADPHDEPVRKRPAYGDADIDALVAYVGSLGNGPPLPNVERRGRGHCQRR